jgi:hypothetical protein
MADTGNPWFIPFAEPSDLVRDWPALSSAVGTAVAAGLTAAGNAGIGSNVVQTVKTNTFSTSSTSFVTITGMTATITPSSSTSKILVIAEIVASAPAAGDSGAAFRLAGGNAAAYVGAASGSLRRAYANVRMETNYGFMIQAVPMVAVYLDSPATTDATTYSVEMAVNTNTAHVNRASSETATTASGRTASSLTLIEVAA